MYIDEALNPFRDHVDDLDDDNDGILDIEDDDDDGDGIRDREVSFAVSINPCITKTERNIQKLKKSQPVGTGQCAKDRLSLFYVEHIYHQEMKNILNLLN